jgi:DNA repair exonuclease SbcCD ATPase subunit
MLFHFSKGRVDRPSVPTSNDVSTPSKMRVKPIVKLREQVVNLIETNKSNPVVSAMAFDTLSEVDSIVMRAMDILDAKRRLQRLSAAVYPSRAAVETLENKVLRSTDSTAKMSIEQALNTRREELRILEELEAEAHRLDANLDEAEAALAELRTQLLKVVAASPKQQAMEEMDPLSGMTDRLRRISTTMEESVEMVTTRIGDN